jgi:hypothetical protein
VHLAIDLQPGRARFEQGARAAAIFSAESERTLPKLECESRATLGSTPKRLTSLAAISVISASCSGVGFSLM